MITRLICILLGHKAMDTVSTGEFGWPGDKGPVLRNTMLFDCDRCGAPIAVRVIEDYSPFGQLMATTLEERIKPKMENPSGSLNSPARKALWTKLADKAKAKAAKRLKEQRQAEDSAIKKAKGYAPTRPRVD